MATATNNRMGTSFTAIMPRYAQADALCEEIAVTQHGVFSRAQALEAGHSSKSIGSRLSNGIWSVLRWNVYRLRGTPRSWEQEMFALHLWCDGPAAGRSAAALHDLRSFKKDTLEVCTNRNLDPPPGVILGRLSPRSLPPTTLIDGIPTTAVEPTILRLAASLGARRAGIALDDALRRGLTTIDSMDAYVEEAAIQGRNGITRTRQLLEVRDHRFQQLRGESENEMLLLFDGVRLPLPEVDYEIWGRGRLIAIADFAYPSILLDIEADTKSFHGGYADQQRDKRRDRSLASIGWRVLRFTREEIVGEPWRVVSDIRAVVRGLDASLLSA